MFAARTTVGTYHNDLHDLYHTPEVDDWTVAREVLVDSDPSYRDSRLPRLTDFIRGKFCDSRSLLVTQCDCV